jgi:hypothetical protein
MEALIDANKKVGLEVNEEETKYMLLSWHQNAGQNHYLKIDNRSFENVAQLRYLENTMIQEEINRRLNSGNAYCHSVQYFSSSCLLSKNIQFKCTNLILSVILYS